LLKSLLIQMRVAARQIAAWWPRAVLSLLIAMPRQFLNLLKQRSTTLRPR